MRRICLIRALLMLLLLLPLTACRSVRPLALQRTLDPSEPIAPELSASVSAPADSAPAESADEADDGDNDSAGTATELQGLTIEQTSYKSNAVPGAAQGSDPVPNASDPVMTTTNELDEVIRFDSVIGSVYESYPLLQSALFSRNIALGQQIGSQGAFDLKLKAASENGPQGFYDNYRQSIGVVQPTYWGGEVFAGYRIGRGDFQPWYQERLTNEGGEFKAGVQIPLARNRTIDGRRAELWKAGVGRQLAEPDIQAQLIEFVQKASYAYWDWVAAGENHSIATRILTLARERTDRIEAQVKAGLVDPPELTDNLRLVAIREAKVADTLRKLQQTAAKLSLYLRDTDGQPIVPNQDQLPGFPTPQPIDQIVLDLDFELAAAQRPEIRMLDLVRSQVQIDYREAVNQLQPELDAVVWGSQDAGAPASSKRDKSQFESEAALYLDVPLQRRKARGKMTELQGKLAQLSAKRKLTVDKIYVDVRVAHAALRSAWDQVEMTQQAVEYAEDLANRERQNQAAGVSDLLKVTLREQYAVESAEKRVEALTLYFESQADYRAAMAADQIDR